jgi:hypothetical protein
MASKDDYHEALTRLTRKTDEGEVTWDAYDPTGELQGEAKAKEGYKTQYKGKELRIFKEVHEEEVDQTVQAMAQSVTLPGDPPKTRTVVKTALVLKDPETEGEWSFPSLSILSDLHSSVKQSSAGVQEWVSDMIDED